MVTTTGTTDTVFSVDELLARSKKAVETKQAAGGSKIQQMLAGRADPQDTVQLSAVEKLTQARAKSVVKESYFDSEQYMNQKVSQLKQQIATYSQLPGLDPSGAVMDGLTREVNEIVTKQQKKLKDSQAAAAAKQAELDKANRFKDLKTVDQLLAGSKSGATKAISDGAQALLDKVRGTSVNKTA